MNKHELLARIFEESSEHLNSLEIYKDYPDVPPRAIDDSISLVQALLREMARRERLLTQRAPDLKRAARKSDKSTNPAVSSG